MAELVYTQSTCIPYNYADCICGTLLYSVCIHAAAGIYFLYTCMPGAFVVVPCDTASVYFWVYSAGQCVLLAYAVHCDKSPPACILYTEVWVYVVERVHIIDTCADWICWTVLASSSVFHLHCVTVSVHRGMCTVSVDVCSCGTCWYNAYIVECVLCVLMCAVVVHADTVCTFFSVH